MSKALIIGNGKSGKAAEKLLNSIGYETIITDSQNISKIRDRTLKTLSLVVLSPAVSIDDPGVKLLKNYTDNIIGEMELSYMFLACKTVAITGTNGKTTTTILIGEMCKKIAKTYVGGNIGVPASSFAKQTKKDDLCVLEVSSFQAESFVNFKPYIGVFLNFSQDHLNRHKTMDSYYVAKIKMFERQTQNDFAVLNFDDKNVRNLAGKLKSNVYYFSDKDKVKGCYLKSDCIYFRDKKVEKIGKMPQSIREAHNKQNALAACTVAKLLGVRNCDILDVLQSFKPSESRIEMVQVVDGISYINDSKGTNIASTLSAIREMKQKTVLIVGGSDKGYEFDDLFTFDNKKVKAIVTVGETSAKIVQAAKRNNYKNIFVANSFCDAILLAKQKAKSGDTVLLSPACASFDMFSSYKERGNAFKAIVREIENESNKNAGETKK